MKFHNLLFLFILLFSLFSCQVSPNGASANTDSTTTRIKPTLEPDKDPLPTFAQLSEIESYMTLQKVTECIGNPQRTLYVQDTSITGTSLVPTLVFYIYDSSDGDSIAVIFATLPDRSDLQTSLIMTVEKDCESIPISGSDPIVIE